MCVRGEEQRTSPDQATIRVDRTRRMCTAWSSAWLDRPLNEVRGGVRGREGGPGKVGRGKVRRGWGGCDRRPKERNCPMSRVAEVVGGVKVPGLVGKGLGRVIGSGCVSGRRG